MSLYKENYKLWCENPVFDEDTKKELLALTDEKEIEERFYKNLEFGTAGLRGIMGAGTNRMNIYTVGKATLGLTLYLKEQFPNATEKGVVIAYDTRNNSPLFARCAADVLTATGIPVYLFDKPVPTPCLSFAVPHFGCVSGIVITASHNPPAYNGYKAYDETGCQLGPDAAKKVLNLMDTLSWEDIPQKGDDTLLTIIGDETIDCFTNTILRQATLDDRKAKEDLNLVYTPIHGTGLLPVTQILEKDGFRRVTVVEAQCTPDGNFPTVKSPNPEERGALEMGIEKAKEIGADLVIGTDPDADRIGCAVSHKGEMLLLSGNQVGALLVDFLLQNRTVLGENPTVISTIVTGDLGKYRAEADGCRVEQVLTGFRFIGNKITAYETARAEGNHSAPHILIGFEESYGYLIGTHARDKDAVVTAMLIAEMAAFHKKEGRTLMGALEALYDKYGYFSDKVESITLQGKEGLEQISAIMAKLRAMPCFLPNTVKTLDFEKGLDGLPPANVLKAYVEGGSWVAARPSGTEPKIEFYYSIRAKNAQEAESLFKALRENVRRAAGLPT